MDTTKKLPVGIENFKEIRTEGFYYVDKTGLIQELLQHWGKVNLFTRPRRFGKTLTINMLKTFFEYECDSSLFNGLKIADEKELCEKYMGQFPVISISLKDIDASNYNDAKAALCTSIGNEAMRFQFLSASSQITDHEKMQYSQLIKIDPQNRQKFNISDETLKDSLLTLSFLLCKHYGQKVILLIDEYDVPLDKAHHFGYYGEMVHLIRNLLSRVLKGNDSLQFAVLTGCLRIAKESIFTGLNNFKIYSITNVRFDEYFGFSDREVKDILNFYGFLPAYTSVKKWYDGYRIGNTDVYCPWDVINYVDLLLVEPHAKPQAFWINTSGNDIIRTFLQMSKQSTRREIEQLIDGDSIPKQIKQELTYRDLYENIDNLWSVLFTTGYLTMHGCADDGICRLAIPNLEIRKIFIEQIRDWFQAEIRKNPSQLNLFCEAFAKADTLTVEAQFNAYLKKTISIRDTAVRKERKENFYHGILLGLLGYREDWDISSNAESGEGFSDILVEIESEGIGIVIELKYADNGNLEAGCKKAIKQISDKAYESRLIEDGMTTIIRYGIACWKKKCKVECVTSPLK